MSLLHLDDVRRILVVKLSSLGDIVHVTPCLRPLRLRFPHARIMMAVEERFAPIIRHNPHLDGLIEAGSGRQGWFRRPLEVRRLLSRHVSPRFDLAIDFQGLWRSALWVYLSHARIQAGRGGPRPGWDCAVKPDLGQHAVRVCATIAEAMGIPVADLDPEIFLSPDADRELGSILQAADIPDKDFLLFNPFSRCRSKEWPLECFAELIGRLFGNGCPAIVLAGGADRMDDARLLMNRLKPGMAHSLVGKLTLDQAMCLYRRARLMVTVDSGPMHVAAALGTPLIALFGPTLPERTGPWGREHSVIQKRRPTHHHAYRTDHARTHMRAIDVASVYEAVMSELDHATADVRIDSSDALSQDP